jgi:hypothetical protein
MGYTGAMAVEGGCCGFSRSACHGWSRMSAGRDGFNTLTLNNSNVTAWRTHPHGVNFRRAPHRSSDLCGRRHQWSAGDPFRIRGSKRLGQQERHASDCLHRHRVVAQQSLAGIFGQDGQDKGIRQNDANSWRFTGNNGDGNDFAIMAKCTSRHIRMLFYGVAVAHSVCGQRVGYGLELDVRGRRLLE